MPRNYNKKKKLYKDIAKKRINYLFNLAEESAHENRLVLANRYVQIARKISMKHLIPMPKEFKRKYCKYCYSFLLPGVNSRIRISRGKVITYCNNCNKFTRYPLKSRK